MHHTLSSSDKKDKKRSAISTLGFALAATLGAALGLIFAPKDGAAIRRNLADKVKNLAHRFTKNREQIQEAVKDIFGEVTDELEKDYIEARSHILAAFDEFEPKEKLSKRKFDAIVEDIVEELSEKREWAKDAQERLTKNLKNEWEYLKDEVSQLREKDEEITYQRD